MFASLFVKIENEPRARARYVKQASVATLCKVSSCGAFKDIDIWRAGDGYLPVVAFYSEVTTAFRAFEELGSF